MTGAADAEGGFPPPVPANAGTPPDGIWNTGKSVSESGMRDA